MEHAARETRQEILQGQGHVAREMRHEILIMGHAAQEMWRNSFRWHRRSQLVGDLTRHNFDRQVVFRF